MTAPGSSCSSSFPQGNPSLVGSGSRSFLCSGCSFYVQRDASRTDRAPFRPFWRSRRLRSLRLGRFSLQVSVPLNCGSFLHRQRSELVFPAHRVIELSRHSRAKLPRLKLRRSWAWRCRVVRPAAPPPVTTSRGTSMANLPPLPPAGRAPQGGKSATGGKANPKDARPDGGSGKGDQNGASKATRSGRGQGDR